MLKKTFIVYVFLRPVPVEYKLIIMVLNLHRIYAAVRINISCVSNLL